MYVTCKNEIFFKKKIMSFKLKKFQKKSFFNSFKQVYLKSWLIRSDSLLSLFSLKKLSPIENTI